MKRFVVKLPIGSDTPFPSIGDERKNVGVIVEAILRSGEKSYDKWVIGEAHKTTMGQDVEALNRVIKKQLGHETQTMFAETSPEEFETTWGPLATTIVPMFQFFGSENAGFADSGYEGKTLYPCDLGVTSNELATVEDCLGSFDWKKILVG